MKILNVLLIGALFSSISMPVFSEEAAVLGKDRFKIGIEYKRTKFDDLEIGTLEMGDASSSNADNANLLSRFKTKIQSKLASFNYKVIEKKPLEMNLSAKFGISDMELNWKYDNDAPEGQYHSQEDYDSKGDDFTWGLGIETKLKLPSNFFIALGSEYQRARNNLKLNSYPINPSYIKVFPQAISLNWQEWRFSGEAGRTFLIKKLQVIPSLGISYLLHDEDWTLDYTGAGLSYNRLKQDMKNKDNWNGYAKLAIELSKRVQFSLSTTFVNTGEHTLITTAQIRF